MPPKTIMNVVAEQFPDLNESETKQLVMKTMSWLTTIGVMSTKQIDKVRVNGEMTKEALIERRAQAIALGVLSKAIAVKFTSEEEQVTAVSEFFTAITGDANGA
jgi:hypothetical protein